MEDEKVLGTKEEFQPPIDDPANQNTTPQEVAQPPEPVAPTKTMSQEEYDALMESKRVTEALLYEIKKAQEQKEQTYQQQPYQAPQTTQQYGRQPVVEEYTEEEREFLEAYPAAKRLMDKNKALENNYLTVQKTIEDMKKADYQKTVQSYQRQIDNDVKRLKSDFPDLKEEDISDILNLAAGHTMRNPNAEITVYGLGAKHASRLGIPRAAGSTQPTQQTNPNGGAILNNTPQNPEPQSIEFKQKPEAKTFDDYFDRGYKDK